MPISKINAYLERNNQMQHPVDQDNILREKLIYRYVQAVDQGDLEEIAAVLEAALDDPELDRIITEIDLAYQEEEKLMPIAQEAQLVRELLHEHLPSAFVTEEVDDKPLTVGEVAARLKANRKVPVADEKTNRLLLRSSVPIPTWLNARVIQKLAEELGVTASKRFWQMFKDTAITLNMGRSHSQAQLLAAREERAQYTYKKVTKPDPSADENSEQEEDE
jgi:hypothetical protein